MEGFCEFRDGGRATTEPLEHLPPCGVGKSLKRLVEVLMVSHLPKYTAPNRLGQHLSDGHATEWRKVFHVQCDVTARPKRKSLCKRSAR